MNETKLLNCYLPSSLFWTFSGILNLTRSLMTFEELESFINAQNAKLAKSNRFLCATIYNAYQYMVVVVKTRMNLNQDIISAHLYYKTRCVCVCHYQNVRTLTSPPILKLRDNQGYLWLPYDLKQGRASGMDWTLKLIF